MLYDATTYANIPGKFFRLSFAGCTAVIIDGREIPVEDVTDEEISSYQINAVWDSQFEVWILADKIADPTATIYPDYEIGE